MKHKKNNDNLRWAKIYKNGSIFALELHDAESKNAFEMYAPLDSLANPLDIIYRWIEFGER